MKTLKNIFAFLVLLPALASCHFLEVEKTGKTSIKNFYSDVYALDAAVNGIYGLTYKFYDNYMVLYPEVAGDLIRFQTATSEWRQQFDFVSDENEETTAVGYIWKNGYESLPMPMRSSSTDLPCLTVFRSRPRLSATISPRPIF